MSSYFKEPISNRRLSIDTSLYGLYSATVQLMIVINIALYNYTSLMILSQIIPMGILVVSFFLHPRIDNTFSSYLSWWVAFASWSLLSVLWGKNPDSYLQQIISIFQCAVVGCVVMALAVDKEKQDKLLFSMLIGGLLLSFRLFLQVPRYAWGTERVGNYIGYGNNSAGIDLSFCSIFAGYQLITKKKRRYLIWCLLFITITIFTGSKKSLLGIIAGMITLVLAINIRNKSLFRTLFQISIIIIITYISIMKIPLLYEAIGRRFEALFSTMQEEEAWLHSESSSASRLYLIREAWIIFQKSPIFGVGLNGFSIYNRLGAYAHNNYLELLCDLGVIGFMIYYWLWLANLTRAINDIKCESYAYRVRIALKIAILIYMLVMDIGLVSFPIESTHIAIALAIAIGQGEPAKVPQERTSKYIIQ